VVHTVPPRARHPVPTGELAVSLLIFFSLKKKFARFLGF
jgi:hypothetical protein